MPKKTHPNVTREPDLFGNNDVSQDNAPIVIGTVRGKKKKTKVEKTDFTVETIFETAYQNYDIKKEEILALDIATHTGFATSIASGVWDLSPKRDESNGMRVIKFHSKLKAIVEMSSTKLIVFEKIVGQYKNTIVVGAELVGILKFFCEQNKIQYRSYSAKEIKKFATGNGNAGKPAMVAAAKRRWNMQGNDDNEADALALLHFTLQDFGLDDKSTII